MNVGELKKLLEGYNDSWRVFCLSEEGCFQTNLSLRTKNIEVPHRTDGFNKYETIVCIAPDEVLSPIDTNKVS